MDYSVKLENFQGPMDLLLHLIRKEEVDVYEISVARVIDQFLEYVEHLEALDVDLASEFSVMAATLMVVKSRMLLPVEEVDLEEEIDPQSDLVHQLLEYKRFRDLSRSLKELGDERSLMFPRRKAQIPEAEVEKDIGDVDLWDLISAFSKVVRETMTTGRIQTIVNEDRPVAEYVDEIIARLDFAGGSLAFERLLGQARTRDAIVGYFIGLLELIRRFRITARQDGIFGSIELVLRTEEEAAKIEAEAAQMGIDSPEEDADEASAEAGDAPELDGAALAEELDLEEVPGDEAELEASAGDEGPVLLEEAGAELARDEGLENDPASDRDDPAERSLEADASGDDLEGSSPRE